MRYDVQFKPKAFKDLKKLPMQLQTEVLSRIEEMGIDLKGDIKRLTGYEPEYRLRVGDYRILFDIEGNTINIFRIRHRREAYR